MEVWKLYFAAVVLLFPSSRAQDTVSQDVGGHQVERLAMLLTLRECEDLVKALSTSEENLFTRLERLSPENNRLKPLSKRAISKAREDEAKCRAALTEWLLEHGQEIYFDRLTRTLQHIGRTDVALEVGKNIIQDKLLRLKKYVAGYHELASSFDVPQEQTKTKIQRTKNLKIRKLKGVDWRALELIIERTPVSRPSVGPMSLILPLIYGFALGFLGMLLIGLGLTRVVLFISLRF